MSVLFLHHLMDALLVRWEKEAGEFGGREVGRDQGFGTLYSLWYLIWKD